MAIEDNFQFSYQSMLFFLRRPDGQGYIFCRADDMRFIAQINASLRKDLEQKGIHVAEVFLQKDSDQPLIHQIETAASNANVLIVCNLYEIVDSSERGRVRLSELNFGREALWKIGKPILFWADGPSMNIIANQAPDLFSQRRHSTVHFTDIMDAGVGVKLQNEGWETFLSTQEFKDLETDVKILEKRLQDAKNSHYPVLRTVNEIALPLAKNYARLGLCNEAKQILKDYEEVFKNIEEENVLRELGDIYYQLHDREKGIQSLRKANELIKEKFKSDKVEVQLPLEWFENQINMAYWSLETGISQNISEELINTEAILEKYEDNPWKFRILSIITGIIGDIMFQKSAYIQSRNYYEKSLKIWQKQIKEEPNNFGLFRDLGVSFNKLGDAQLQLGNLPEAKRNFLESMLIREKLSSINSKSEILKRDYCISLERLGTFFCGLGDFQNALTFYTQLIMLRIQLIEANPNSERLNKDLCNSYCLIAIMYQKQGNPDAARNYYQKALSIFKKLSEANPSSVQLKDDIANIESAISKLEIEPSSATPIH